MSKQSGFSAIEIVIVIVAVSLVAFGGWRIYDSNQSSNDNTNNAQQASNKEAPANTASNEKITKRKSFTAYGISLSIDELKGWEYTGMYGYPGVDSNEYEIDILNKTRDIQLSLQVSEFKTSLYKQDILDTFTGFNGETYYITNSVDDTPGDTRYQQLGISACDNGHCVTKINNTYNLNANITPTVTNTDFSGSRENLSEIKKLFSSIVIK